MTTITYTEHKSKVHLVKISLDGHADLNPGNDPVCAALSTITYQLLGVVNMLEEREFISDLAAEAEPGHTVISFRVLNHQRWRDAWEIIHIGYGNIAKAYPNNVFFSGCN